MQCKESVPFDQLVAASQAALQSICDELGISATSEMPYTTVLVYRARVLCNPREATLDFAPMWVDILPAVKEYMRSKSTRRQFLRALEELTSLKACYDFESADISPLFTLCNRMLMVLDIERPF